MSEFPFKEHDQRLDLAMEVHARPYMPLKPPVRGTHVAIYSGEDAADDERRHVAKLCERYDHEGPKETENAFTVDLGDFRLKWERHTEFSTYTFFADEPVPDEPFRNTVIDRVPQDWLQAIPGELIVGVHLEMAAQDAPERTPEETAALFGPSSLAGAQVAGGAATAFMDFWVNEDGYGRLLIHDHGLHLRQAGRLVQRLLEIETYRTMALLAFPLAKAHGKDLSRIGARLMELTGQMSEIRELEDERRLLEDLTLLSAETERIAARTAFRFGAATAYYELVRRRISELRESRLEGFQEFGEFMDRRLTPAMRTCDAVAARLDTLSKRITRAGQLLRTRVDIQVEQQNRDLLKSMDRRAQLQLRLQETVEGLSVAAISYYVVGLIGYLFDGMQGAGLPVEADVPQGVAVPIVLGLAWVVMRRLRRLAKKDTKE